jgi:hypothetical protein
VDPDFAAVFDREPDFARVPVPEADADRLRPDALARFRGLGTLAPFFRASDSPIAMACLRLVTVPPLPPFPLLSVPFFRRRIALSTDLPAACPYRRLPDLALVAIGPSLVEPASGFARTVRTAGRPSTMRVTTPAPTAA